MHRRLAARANSDETRANSDEARDAARANSDSVSVAKSDAARANSDESRDARAISDAGANSDAVRARADAARGSATKKKEVGKENEKSDDEAKAKAFESERQAKELLERAALITGESPKQIGM